MVAVTTSAFPEGTIPAFQTWYGSDELARVFHRAYSGLAPEVRAARGAFPSPLLDDAFDWNLHAARELPGWSESRFNDYLSAVDREDRVHGLGGIGVVTTSPSAAFHLLSSYGRALDCHDAGPPPAHAVGAPKESVVQRARVAVDACASVDLDPLSLLPDETLHAVLSALPPDASASWVDAKTGMKQCEVNDVGCLVSGPGEFYVSIDGAATPIDGEIVFRRTSRAPEWSTCLESPFTADSVVVKAAFRRAQFEERLPVYDFSAEGLAKRLGTEDVSWESPDGDADPGPDAIYTLELPGGERYRLAGLHIMTKELDHWMWISLFWSPHPNEDFGEDRPASLTGPWSNYGMCVVTSFDEGDADPTGGYTDKPSLARALAAVHAGVGGPSWCSNPYIERGRRNAGTNCIGCHQHAGTALLSEEIVNDDARFPARGRTLLRNNFPTDYSWMVTHGDELVQTFIAEEQYFAR
jgi:hypothetical protein